MWYDLTEAEMYVFKDVLVAMKGMEKVVIHGLHVS